MEWETEDGQYTATWSQKTSGITLTMPGGATLSALGHVVTYNPVGGALPDGAGAHPVPCPLSPAAPLDPSSPFPDAPPPPTPCPLFNTHGCYIFDVVRVSLSLCIAL